MTDQQCPNCARWEALAREKNWGYVHDARLDQLVAEVSRWRSIVARLVSTWNRGWDCSRTPGHSEVDDAMGDAEIALSDATIGNTPSGGSYEAFLKGM